MSALVYYRGFARFGNISYSLQAKHYIIIGNYIITLDKRMDGNLTERVTIPTEIMEVVFNRLPYVFESIRRKHMWITTMKINNLLNHELFSANVYYLNHSV